MLQTGVCRFLVANKVKSHPKNEMALQFIPSIKLKLSLSFYLQYQEQQEHVRNVRKLKVSCES